MYEKELRELFELYLRVLKETKKWVCLDFSSKSYRCCVYIYDDDFNNNGILKSYYCNNDLEDYEMAKEHLLLLLEKGDRK